MQGLLLALRRSRPTGLQDLHARLARTTPRERMLIAGLAAGALFYAPFAAFEWRSEQEARYSEALIDQSSARLALAAARRVQQTAQDDAALRDMADWGFEGSNLDVVQVRIEQRLMEDASEAGLENFQVQFQQDAEAYGPTIWALADVEASLKWGPTFAFLDALAEWPEGFRVVGFAYEGYVPPGSSREGAQQSAPRITGVPKVRLTLAFPLVESVDLAAP